MKTQAITLIKEDVLSLGRMVSQTVLEVMQVLNNNSKSSLILIEEQEEKINNTNLNIEEKCLDLLHEKQDLTSKEIRTVVGGTLIAAKLERLADHANRVAKLASCAHTDKVEIPKELTEMVQVVSHLLEDVMLCFLSDDISNVQNIISQDSKINYLHDVLSKNLLSSIGEQTQIDAQAQTQFLFCARYIERMGDACVSIAKRVYFIVTGQRLNKEKSISDLAAN